MHASLSLSLHLLLGIYLIKVALCDIGDEAKLRFYQGSFENFTEFTLSDSQKIFNTDWYNSSHSTVIFTHGFTGHPKGPAVTAIIKAYLKLNTHNVALLNWDQLAAGTHPGLVNAYLNRAVPNAKQLGATFSKTLQNLSVTGLDLNNTLLIGHSLGAHIFGIAGNTLRNQAVSLPWIIGLDPAAAVFQGKPPSMRLHAGSADYVEVIHSDPSKYGFARPTGTVDFWPNYRNGPVRQPGCERSGPMFSPEDICSHNRSWELLVDSLEHPATILGINAKNYRAWKNGKDKNAIIREVGKRPKNITPGNYYFFTNSESPYGLGLEECTAVNIERLEVPSLVKMGTDFVVLDCQFSGSTGPGSGLVMKWFFNGSSGLVYQWIPPMQPQVIGLLKGKVDMKFRISEEPLQAYRAIKIVKPTTDLSGNYTCVVSTFMEEDHRTKPMLVYKIGSSFQFYQEKKYVFLVTLICLAKDLYPIPEMAILSKGTPLKQTAIETKMDSWGLYSVSATAVVHDDDVTNPFEEFVCTLSLPSTGYAANRTTVYHPGLMPTAHIADVEMEKHQESHTNDSPCLKSSYVLCFLFGFLKLNFRRI